MCGIAKLWFVNPPISLKVCQEVVALQRGMCVMLIVEIYFGLKTDIREKMKRKRQKCRNGEPFGAEIHHFHWTIVTFGL